MMIIIYVVCVFVILMVLRWRVAVVPRLSLVVFETVKAVHRFPFIQMRAPRLNFKPKPP